MNNKNQLLQLFSINPEIAETLMQQYIDTFGMNLGSKREKVRKVVVEQLIHYAKLIGVNRDRELVKEFFEVHNLKLIFGNC